MTKEHSWGIAIVFLIILTLCEVAAELLLKPPADSTKYDYRFYLGCGVYIVIGVLLAHVLRQMPEKLGVINTVWQALNIVIVFSVSYLFFKEKFKLIQYIGVVIAMIAAVLMVLPEVIDIN
jgi:multidrug transporter EmrE-like cation transporter